MDPISILASAITFIGAITKTYETINKISGLPKAFDIVKEDLPLVQRILENAQNSITSSKPSEEESQAILAIIKPSNEKAKELKRIFDEVQAQCKGDQDAKDWARVCAIYHKALRGIKAHRVETLMDEILKGMKKLALSQVFKSAMQEDLKAIEKAIEELSKVEPSVTDSEFDSPGTIHASQAVQTGASGQQNIPQGGVNTFYGGNVGGSSGTNNFGGHNGTNTFVNISSQDTRKKDEESCIRALFLTDPRDDRDKLVDIKISRTEGTCEWIKTNTLYNTWFHSDSQLLWLSGGPGKGKTMLSIFLAEEIEKEIKKTTKDALKPLFLQYFCDNSNENRNTAVSIIRGLIYQFLKLQPKLFDHILPDFKLRTESLFTSSSLQILWRIFEAMLHNPVLNTVYCILDGLDECNKASLGVLLGKFATLLSPKSSGSPTCNFKLIIASRNFPDIIPEVLSEFPRIQLDSDANDQVINDIHQFIEVEVDKLSRDKNYPEPLCAYVKEVFRNRAHGTFLWVGIVAPALREYNATEVQGILKASFAPGLEELYARMLLQIDGDNRRQIAAKILRWVVMAVRPLTLSELSAAINVEPPNMFNWEQAIRDQLLYCGEFLKINKYKGGVVVSLIHQSAKDYLLHLPSQPNSDPRLEIFHIKEDKGHLEIAKTCFDYLQNGALQDGEVNLYENTTHLKAFPLLSYATLHWPYHAKSLTGSEDIFNLSLPFYQKKSPIRESWLKTYWRAIGRKDIPDSYSLLHLASYFGIVPLVRNLLITPIYRLHSLNKINGDGETALHIAILRSEAVVRLLLQNMVDIEAKTSNGQTALHLATLYGKGDLVQLLLENGANSEAKNGDGWTALHMAATTNQEDLVTLLLKNRADIKAESSDGYIALHLAALAGHEAIVQLLLQNGEDIETKARNGYAALHIVVLHSDTDKARMLLKNGADIDAKNRDGLTALHIAVIDVKVGFISLFAKNDDEDTASSSQEDLVRLLLQNRADIESKNSKGMTALHISAQLCQRNIVQLLLQNGANIETKNYHGMTALLVAASSVLSNQEELVRILLENKADIKAKTIDGWMVLHYAMSAGQKDLLGVLLENGVEIEDKDSRGLAALHIAAQLGLGDTVQLLLHNRAAIDAKDIDGRTALHLAAFFGWEDVVRLLLDNGAEIDAKSNCKWTALYFAHTILMEVSRPLPRTVVVIGAGAQGRRLAYMWSSRGSPVHLVDLEERKQQEALLYIQQLRAKSTSDGSNWGEIMASTPNSLESWLKDAWLVVECVPENLALKRKIIIQLDKFAPEGTIIASNSSSYGISEILDGEKLLDWPPETTAIEIMGHNETDPSLIALLLEQCKAHGFSPFHVKQSSIGYIYNRIWAAIKRETLLALSEGVGSPQEIDAIFKDVLKTPKGPCELMDIVGLDVVLDIENHYADSRIGIPPEPRDYVQKMIQNGHLGIKSGRGFYNYTGTLDEKHRL
ncbi:hypothetical protein VE04_01787 [Pseudogymnoascus sp. 24MN13]|nr:hypothetical protein VE04_01787 [Pseudogymnoascus sp. 24MN13]